MKKSTWIAIAGATVLFAAFLVLWQAAQRPTVPPEQEVRQRLEEIRQAVEQRDLSKLMEALSQDFEAFGYSRERLRIEIASAFRRGVRPQLRYSYPAINVIGDQATVSTRVEVWWEEQGTLSRHEPTNVEILMRKEPARQWLFFPTKRWRIVDVQGVSASALE